MDKRYTLVYSINNEPNPKTVYVNLTNACTNSCVFCLREQKDDVCGAEMWHDDNYTLEDVIEQFESYITPHPDSALKSRNTTKNLEVAYVRSTPLPQGARENYLPQNVVFCGYGEPFLKKDMMKKFAQYLRENHPEIKIRVNTNGHANAIYKTNVAEEFKGLLDEASVSLNSDNSEQYDEICQPKIENAYDAVKDFLRSCKKAGIKTYASIVTGFDERKINAENCERIAKELGAEFRNREFITNGY